MRIFLRGNYLPKARGVVTKQKSANKFECKRRKAAYQKLHGPLFRAKLTPEYKLWQHAKHRAQENKILFNIQPKDIKIPLICPLLKVPLIFDKGRTNASSPTLDRLENSGGYTSNNIWVISHRANTAKNNLSLLELKRLVENLETEIMERKIRETR